MAVRIEQQCHGYKSGHQLLAASTRLPRGDQDVVDRLSDVSGPLRPAETFEPYLTAYPLPSGSFYVLARTWQDLKALRAGCVLTRSLLVPMAAWEAIEFPASLIELLMPVDKQENAIASVEFDPHPVQLSKVASRTTIALVEALFLESRKSIVLFDELESTLIAERLLSAFWPAMRRVFSLCTMALSPRSVSGAPFDLMFAPRGARSRFSEWEGRIVDASSSREDISRHPWTAVTAKHIFEDDPPSLLSLDALGMLRDDERADESTLRLALLWNELLEKSESSPTAILGLLDILNSRGKSSSEDLLPFVQLLSRGVDLAQRSMSSSDALRFLLTLSGKFPSRRPPINVLNKIRAALSGIAEREPKAALALLLDSSLGKQTRVPIVAAGIGDGLARLRDSSEILALANSLPAEDGLRLLAYSRAWARALMLTTEKAAPDLWTEVLAKALQYPDGNLRAKSRRNVVPFLRIPSHAVLLRAVLRETDNGVLFSVAEKIRDTTQFAIAEFDEPLRSAARGTEGIQGLRRTILAGEPNTNSDRFLVVTIGPNANGITWLFREESLTSQRRSLLLNSVLSRASERDLQSLVQDAPLGEKIEETLVEGLPFTAEQLARLLVTGNLPVKRLLRNGCRVLSLLETSQQADLALRMLTLGLSSADKSENTALEELISKSATFVDPHRLVALAVSGNATKQRLSDNVVLLNRADREIRRGVLADIEELSDRLIGRRYEATSEELVLAWSQLLADAGSVDRRAQTNAAGSVLSFALEERRNPVSPLIVVAFPIVYAELRAGKEAPRLFSLFFEDWDRCKTARRSIVHAFLQSIWPTVDLVKAVEPTGDLDQVFKRLLRDRGGESFLTRLRNDVSKLSAEERRPIETALGKALNEVQTEKGDDTE
jgi:GTPase-associated protein 1, N-terminal domain type 1